MKVHHTALKHGISAEDAAYAAANWVFAGAVADEEPGRQFRLGFDHAGRLLEIVVLHFDSGNELLIHAMKARRRYWSLLD